MRYYKQYREDGAVPFEITKDEARNTLDGYWMEEALNDIFQNDRSFRLYTPVADVWTVTEKGTIPIAGFYGIVG